MNETPPSLNQPHWRDVLPDLQGRLGAERILIASDFDGTLAPLAPTPDAAVILPAARASLDRLSRLPGVTVAVISGRALAGVRQKVDLPVLIYAGNHGLEMEGPLLPPVTLLTPDARQALDAALNPGPSSKTKARVSAFITVWPRHRTLSRLQPQ
jgi:trehalose-6-phosphatase